MSIHFETTKPKDLLNAFKKAIDDEHVVTWSYDSDGDFTHTAEQWKNKAWLRPKIITDRKLVLIILRPKSSAISSEVYAIYHGRFIESMLKHCDKLFTNVVATALPSDGDQVSNE